MEMDRNSIYNSDTKNMNVDSMLIPGPHVTHLFWETKHIKQPLDDCPLYMASFLICWISASGKYFQSVLGFPKIGLAFYIECIEYIPLIECIYPL